MLKNLPVLLALLSVGGILNMISHTITLSVPFHWIVLLLGVALVFYSAVCLVAYNINQKRNLSSK
ncbi:hypothetical protein C1T28_12695 [Bacillus subtilis]|nr:hypothetical protein C1T25_03280 [Bacillus cereus]POO73775.1 hypothetical protein C1T28_12695 [Bacillus subtilis]RJS54819.1 hypothetical protein CJ481_02025 [Bacillus subtilis]